MNSIFKTVVSILFLLSANVHARDTVLPDGEKSDQESGKPTEIELECILVKAGVVGGVQVATCFEDGNTKKRYTVITGSLGGTVGAAFGFGGLTCRPTHGNDISGFYGGEGVQAGVGLGVSLSGGYDPKINPRALSPEAVFKSNHGTCGAGGVGVGLGADISKAGMVIFPSKPWK